MTFPSLMVAIIAVVVLMVAMGVAATVAAIHIHDRVTELGVRLSAGASHLQELKDYVAGDASIIAKQLQDKLSTLDKLTINGDLLVKGNTSVTSLEGTKAVNFPASTVSFREVQTQFLGGQATEPKPKLRVFNDMVFIPPNSSSSTPASISHSIYQ